MQANCGTCGKKCTAEIVDNGIGAYEFWGAPGVDHHYVVESDCCNAECLDDNGMEVTIQDVTDWDEGERDYNQQEEYYADDE